MVRKLKLLDLCCCAGGASYGYALAGFEVIGVDLEAQPDYPFEFHQADALTFPLDGFDAIHVSPHCQHFSLASTFHPGTREKYPDQILSFRERLEAASKPYIMENVAGSSVRKDVMLCGTMFNLQVIRHRYFESNVHLFSPHHPDICRKHLVKVAKPGAIAHGDEYWSVGGHFGKKDRAQRAMGIDWMKTQYEIAQAIPPAYTKFLGDQLMAILINEGAA